MTSQGQRFRRRALRRGYKVDEVDAFLDRVEATLAGDQVGTSVSAQEVHDVVFRVRFGGYDEWQVDLHLDRVERQLAELEEQGAGGRPVSSSGMERTAERVPERMAPARSGAAERGADRYDEPAYADRDRDREPAGFGRGDTSTGRDRTEGGFGYGRDSAPGGRERAQDEPGGFGRRDPRDDFDNDRGDDTGFGVRPPGRHGKADMTSEMRIPPADGFTGGFAARGGASGRGLGEQADRPADSGFGGAAAGGSPASGPAPAVGGSPDAQRVDALRRGFQTRRFGSGYDLAEVDGLFDALVAGLSGRGQLPANAANLEQTQFALVPGGYFEAEVDAALREVADILRRY